MSVPGLVVEFMPGAGPFDIAGDHYLDVPAGHAETPDNAAYAVTDLHVRVEVTLDEWKPPANRFLAAQYQTAGDQRGWFFGLTSAGQLFVQWSTNGTSGGTAVRISSIPLPADTGRLAVGVKLDVNNGAGGNTVTFETAPSIAGPWTDLSTETQAGTTSIHNSTSVLEVGNALDGASTPLGGRAHAMHLLASIGGAAVANPDFTAQPPGTTSFVDAAGRTWTVNGGASIAGFDWVRLTEGGPHGKRVLEAEWEEGRAGELERFTACHGSVRLKNDDRLFDPQHDAGTYAGELLPRVPFRIRSQSITLDLPGVAGAYASTPDHASLDIAGDIDLRWFGTADDWTPAANDALVAKWNDVAVNQRSYLLRLDTAGNLVLFTSADGTVGLSATSTVALSPPTSGPFGLRATQDVDNGAGQRVTSFFTSIDDGASWTPLGTVVTQAGAISIFNSTAPLEVGTRSVGTLDPFAGNVDRVEVRDGIGAAAVANPDFTRQPPGATSFVDAAGRTWAVNGTASIVFDSTVLLDQYYGFVEDGWEQEPQPPELSDCQVQLVDMLGVLDALPLPGSGYQAEVLNDGPLAFWELDEETGTQMADSSGNGFHGQRDNGEAVEPLVTGGGKAFRAPHVGDNRGIFIGEGLPTGPPCTIEAWVQTPRDLAAFKTIAGVQRDSALGSSLFLDIFGTEGPNGELVIRFSNLGGSYRAHGDTRIDDDRPHHVVATIGSTAAADIKLYVDGIEQAKTVISGTTGGSWPGHLWWTVANTADSTAGDWGLDGIADDVAIYDRALTATEIADHYQAGTNGFAGEAVGDRISRVLDIVGVPASLRDIATGDTFAGPASYGNQSAGAYIDGLVESEQGFFYVDHHNAGKVKFRGRYSRLTDPRATVSQATFTDDDTPAAKHYERGGLEIDPNGISSMVNQVEVRWPGGTVVEADQASVRRYGPQSRTINTEAPSPVAAASAGQWLIGRYGQPQTRVRGVELFPSGDGRLWPEVLDLRVSDRVTLERHPQQVAAQIVNELTIEQVHHHVVDVEWRTRLRFSSADLSDVWIWGVAEWGVSTVWG